jgi:hypothetical protein
MASKTNTTYYSIGTNNFDILYPRSSECMALSKGVNGLLNLIIPFESLHKGLSEKDVYKWVELGNSSIFKASIRKGFSFFTSKHLLLNKKLKEESLEIARKEKKKLDRNDSKYLLSGKILSLAGGIDDPSTLLVAITEEDDNYNKGSFAKVGCAWAVSINDFEFKNKSIDISLNDYIKEKIKEIETDEHNEEKENCYIVSIDGSLIKEPEYRLAVTTYYRYLWSSNYPEIVSDTLKIMETGVSFWDALMLVHASTRKEPYSNYYGLCFASIRGIPEENSVLFKLKKSNEGVNSCFRGEPSGQPIKPFFIHDQSDFAEILGKLKSGGVIGKTAVCVNSDKTQNLTVGGHYRIIDQDYNLIKIVDKWFFGRWYLINRFEIN